MFKRHLFDIQEYNSQYAAILKNILLLFVLCSTDRQDCCSAYKHLLASVILPAFFRIIIDKENPPRLMKKKINFISIYLEKFHMNTAKIVGHYEKE